MSETRLVMVVNAVPNGRISVVNLSDYIAKHRALLDKMEAFEGKVLSVIVSSEGIALNDVSELSAALVADEAQAQEAQP